jgi:RNA recognition motif-containing protein
MTKVYVGNLSFDTNEDHLRELFSAYGAVEGINVITDRVTGRPRGFGFIEMTDASAAKAAIDGLNGKEQGGRPLTVNEARPRREGGGRGDRR